MNLLNGLCPVKGLGGGVLHTSSKLFRGWVKSGRCKSGSWHKRKNLQILNPQILAALLIHQLTTTTDNYCLQPQTLTQIIFSFFFVAIADVYKNEGNEAFKKGDFINAIHFYTKGIKMNCNEKELKAKLHNNRAIAHFKLGKMMRALICISSFLR